MKFIQIKIHVLSETALKTPQESLNYFHIEDDKDYVALPLSLPTQILLFIWILRTFHGQHQIGQNAYQMSKKQIFVKYFINSAGMFIYMFFLLLLIVKM